MQRFLIILVLVVFSCSEERIVDNSVFEQKFLLATDEEKSALILYDSRNGILENDVYQKNNSKSLQGKVTAIKEWGNLLFLIMSEDYIVEIINKNNFTNVATIDFSKTQSKPTDISFVNSTDAYISFSNDSVIVLYDLYNFKIARQINVDNISVDLVAAEQFVYVTNQNNDRISIIDSRTDEIINFVSVKPVPAIVDYSETFGKVAVVSLGNGKIDEEQKTGAYLTILDVNSQSKTSEILISSNSLDASEILPENMIIAGTYCFISTSDYIFRFDIKNEPEQIQLLSKKKIKSMKYFSLRNKVIVLEDDNNFSYCNPYTLGAEYKFQINRNINAVHPL